MIQKNVNTEWEAHLASVQSEQDPGWEERYRPGSYGCHELLDRVLMLGDLVESQLLEHPACALNEEWYSRAVQAAETLRELYQRIGAAHLGSPSDLA
jgi:hypothetical protein